MANSQNLNSSVALASEAANYNEPYPLGSAQRPLLCGSDLHGLQSPCRSLTNVGH